MDSGFILYILSYNEKPNFLCTVHLLEIKIFAYETKLLVSYPMVFLDSNFDYYVVTT